ncbi:MAG: hypothetical protein LBT30_07340 [Clostridiales bacterium]|jgi:hypothetical protein|nr:hypothetical protein [Clostridiales bacterium]
MALYFSKKEFNDDEWAEGEYYVRPKVSDSIFSVLSNDSDALSDDDAFEDFGEFGMPEGYEYRDGWIYVGENKEAVKDDYYHSLTPELQAEFKDLFIDRNRLVISRCPAYLIDGDNTIFFQLIFSYITRYRKIISVELLESLYDYLFSKFIENPKLLTKLNDKLIRIYFARRAESDNLKKCEEKCREDIAFNLEYIPDYPSYLDSYKRLVIILENRNDFEEAKAFCERAIHLGLTDRTKSDYVGRLEKINKKQAL